MTIEDGGYRNEGRRYGFVDASGALVVPPRYESYDYCFDGLGRVNAVIVTTAGRRAEVLDLTGTVLRRLPTAAARCGPTGTAVFTLEVEPEGGDWRDGLIDLGTGRVLVALARQRHVDVVDDAHA